MQGAALDLTTDGKEGCSVGFVAGLKCVLRNVVGRFDKDLYGVRERGG